MQKITNTQPGPRGVNAKGGIVMIDPGQTVDVDIDAGELENSRKTGWFEFDGAEAAPKPSLEAKHVGGGSYFIMDGDNRVGDAMKKEDAEAFNALSDEEKAKFAAKG